MDIHYDTLRKAQQTIFGGSFVLEYYKWKQSLKNKDNDYIKELQLQKRELEKEKIKFRDERNAWQKQIGRAHV